MRALDGIGPGTVLVHRTGDTKVISHRKEDDSGWWLTDGSGLVDRALASDWTVGGDSGAEAGNLAALEQMVRTYPAQAAKVLLETWALEQVGWVEEEPDRYRFVNIDADPEYHAADVSNPSLLPVYRIRPT